MSDKSSKQLVSDRCTKDLSQNKEYINQQPVYKLAAYNCNKEYDSGIRDYKQSKEKIVYFMLGYRAAMKLRLNGGTI